MPEPHAFVDSGASLEQVYLDLLKRCLTRTIAEQAYAIIEPRSPIVRLAFRPFRGLLSRVGIGLVRRYPSSSGSRVEGRDWPTDAETMVGLKRLDNLQACIQRIIEDDVRGDLIECGVWRGGASIFMRGVLKAHGDARTVWVADSFRGLPKPRTDTLRSDIRERLWVFESLSVPLHQVQANFARYGLLDGQVRFVAGWFRDTLPRAPIDRLALLRLDADMYDSTCDALNALYPKLSIGGFCVIDDYFAIPGTRKAVDDYRAEHQVVEPVERIDWTGAFWRRVR